MRAEILRQLYQALSASKEELEALGAWRPDYHNDRGTSLGQIRTHNQIRLNTRIMAIEACIEIVKGVAE